MRHRVSIKNERYIVKWHERPAGTEMACGPVAERRRQRQLTTRSAVSSRSRTPRARYRHGNCSVAITKNK